MKKRIVRERPRRQGVYNAARAEGLSHVQADILCRRSLSEKESLTPFYDPRLKEISPPQLLKNCELAVARIVEAIRKGEHIGLATDYDVDGLTANAVGQKSFGDYFGVRSDLIHSFVGNRLQDGYGLTDQLCARILAHTPPVSLLITADCGVSDERRIALLKEAGVDVIVTDHHLVPEHEFPSAAYALVNPQQQRCPYPDKTISGSMVCWLVMSAVRTELLTAGLIAAETPTLIALLDYVALATIADSVSLLSPINRAVVRYGLLEINKFVRPCWQVLEFGSRPLTRLTEGDLAF
ncbi:MAG: DHH family phosphoesterase, partial [Deltaproteobacteria bacterium]|nr:DHH family phosphoesterase [Deltaproteobacteria bacterium]